MAAAKAHSARPHNDAAQIASTCAPTDQGRRRIEIQASEGGALGITLAWVRMPPVVTRIDTSSTHGKQAVEQGVQVGDMLVEVNRSLTSSMLVPAIKKQLEARPLIAVFEQPEDVVHEAQKAPGCSQRPSDVPSARATASRGAPPDPAPGSRPSNMLARPTPAGPATAGRSSQRPSVPSKPTQAAARRSIEAPAGAAAPSGAPMATEPDRFGASSPCREADTPEEHGTRCRQDPNSPHHAWYLDWQPLPLSAEGPQAARGEAVDKGVTDFRLALQRCDVLVVRVGVGAGGESSPSKRPRPAHFKVLMPCSLLGDAHSWCLPLKAAVLANEEGAAEALSDAAAERMNRQGDAMEGVMKALGEEMPEDFGAVWVLVALEPEHGLGAILAPTKLGLVAFQYVKDEDAAGPGGASANRATRQLSQHWSAFMKSLKLGMVFETVKEEFAPRSDAHEALSTMYACVFGFASQILGKGRRKPVEDALADVHRFAESLQAFTSAGEDARIRMIERANELVAGHDDGSSPIHSGEAMKLVRFLRSHGGILRREVHEAARLQDVHRREEKKRTEKAFQELQAGPEAGRFPEQGQFELAGGRFNPMLPILFDDALSKGQWVCFRMDSECMTYAHYQILHVPGHCGSSHLEELTAWQSSFPTADHRPLNLFNINTLTNSDLEASISSFNRSSMERYDAAVAFLGSVAEAQTLCVYRFQAPLESPDQACRTRPSVLELPTTWAGAKPNPWVLAPPKTLTMKAWLLLHGIIRSDFVKNSGPGAVGTSYTDAVTKGLGRMPQIFARSREGKKAFARGDAVTVNGKIGNITRVHPAHGDGEDWYKVAFSDGQTSGFITVKQIEAAKACAMCRRAYSGFGDRCGGCRRLSSKGRPTECESCHQFFSGFGDLCSDCRSESLSEGHGGTGGARDGDGGTVGAAAPPRPAVPSLAVMLRMSEAVAHWRHKVRRGQQGSPAPQAAAQAPGPCT